MLSPDNTKRTPLEALQHAVAALMSDVAYMRGIAVYAPLSVQIEVNNLQEVLDLLIHKLRLAAEDNPVDSGHA